MSMSSDETMSDENAADTLRDLFVVEARNAHAMEKEALQLIDRQLDRLENFPMVSDRLREHREETERQHDRLDQILQGMDEGRSVIKDMAMALMGNMGALAHTAADDEILKNTSANLAFENFEIGSYLSLIAIGEKAGMTDAVRMLRQSLDEEERMAAWIKDHVDAITRRHLALRLTGETADR